MQNLQWTTIFPPPDSEDQRQMLVASTILCQIPKNCGLQDLVAHFEIIIGMLAEATLHIAVNGMTLDLKGSFAHTSEAKMFCERSLRGMMRVLDYINVDDSDVRPVDEELPS